MAGAIKGITVEIGGDTTKLGKALADVNTQSKSLQSELKGVNTLLKMDPSNVTLLKQKQDILNSSIATTKDKLMTLKSAQQQVQEQFDKGEITEEQYRDFQREIVNTEQKLKSLEDEAKSFGSVAEQQFKQAGESVKAVGDKVSGVGDSLKGMSAVAGATLAGSTKLASDFEDGVAKVGTVADTSTTSLEHLSEDMLNLSTQTGKSATEITDATYQAISASVDTSKAVEFVGTATDLAKAGFLDTADAVDVLTTVINAYGLEADDAETISNQLVQTQNDGKTTVNELSSSMGQVIPLAAAYGVNIDNLCTSYAQLTKNGIATSQAGTYMKSMLTELGDSGSSVSGILQEKTGKTFAELMDSGSSLGDVLSILNESVDGNATDFANLWSSTEAGTGALSLVSSGADAFNEELGKMGDCSTNVADALETLDTPSAKVNKAFNALKNTGITLGETVLEALTPVLESLATALQNLTTWFGSLDPGVKTVIATVLALVAGLAPLLLIIGKVITTVGTIMTVVAPIITFFTGTVIPAISAVVAAINWPLVAIAAVIAAVVLLYTKCEWFRDAVNAVVQAIVDFVSGVVDAVVTFFTVTLPEIFIGFLTAFENFKTSVTTAASNLWTAITTVFSVVLTWINDNIITPITTAVTTFFTAIKTAATTLWTAIKTVFTVVANWVKTNILTPVKTAVSTVFNGIKTAASSLWNGIKSVFSSVGSWFRTKFTEAYNGVKSVFSSIGTFFSGVWNGIKTTFSTLGTSIGSAISDAVKSGINGVISMIQNTINGAISLINGAIGLINKLPGVSVSKISELSLPRLAKGGVLAKGQVGLLEGDGAEAVVPLEKNTEWINRVAEKLNGSGSSDALLGRIDKLEAAITNMRIVLDTGTLVGATVSQYDRALGQSQLMKARGI